MRETSPDDPEQQPSLQLLTVEEVAALLKLTRKGIYALVEARRIPFLKISNRLRFDYRDVVAWLWGNRVPASEK